MWLSRKVSCSRAAARSPPKFWTLAMSACLMAERLAAAPAGLVRTIKCRWLATTIGPAPKVPSSLESPNRSSRVSSLRRMRQDCSKVRPHSYNSGGGKLWEFYHYLIDFAPLLQYYLQQNNLSYTHIYVPNNRDYRFSLTFKNDQNRSMVNIHQLLFPNTTFTIVKNDTMLMESECTILPGIRNHFGPIYASSWSKYDPAIWNGFTKYLRRRLAHCFAPSYERDVMIVRRGKRASSRRHLPDEFFQNATTWLSQKNLSHQVQVLEDLSFCQQIHMFSSSRIIVAMHGAALSNLIFSRCDSTVIELRDPDFRKRVPYQMYEYLANQFGIGYFRTPSRQPTTDAVFPLIERAFRTSSRQPTTDEVFPLIERATGAKIKICYLP